MNGFHPAVVIAKSIGIFLQMMTLFQLLAFSTLLLERTFGNDCSHILKEVDGGFNRGKAQIIKANAKGNQIQGSKFDGFGGGKRLPVSVESLGSSVYSSECLFWKNLLFASNFLFLAGLPISMRMSSMMSSIGRGNR